jgi:hypothetical protein
MRCVGWSRSRPWSVREVTSTRLLGGRKRSLRLISSIDAEPRANLARIGWHLSWHESGGTSLHLFGGGDRTAADPGHTLPAGDRGGGGRSDLAIGHSLRRRPAVLVAGDVQVQYDALFGDAPESAVTCG